MTNVRRQDKNMVKVLKDMKTYSNGSGDLAATLDTLEDRPGWMEQSDALAVPSTERRVEPAEKSEEILGEHQTAPHKLLLLWPSVRSLLRAARVTKDDDYVMEAEDRGILQFFTRHEDVDDRQGIHPAGLADSARSDDSGSDDVSTNAPAAPENL